MANNIYSSSYSYYIVYETVCKVNQKIYIGCHATNDLDDGYLGSGSLLTKAIKKYGRNNFSRKILYQFDNPIDMFDKERELVTEDFIRSGKAYNLVVGGSGGFKVQDINDWKNKLKESSALRENKQPMLGKTHSEETKKRISSTNKGRTPWNKGLPGTWVDRKHSEESKQKISQNRKGLTAGKNNPMYGKSAVAGRKWYHDGVKSYYLFPEDPATASLITGRLKKPSS
jgi:group I intron endonuclease